MGLQGIETTAPSIEPRLWGMAVIIHIQSFSLTQFLSRGGTVTSFQMNTKYKYSQLVGIVIAYIIVCVAAIPAIIDLIGLLNWKDNSGLWGSYLTELFYYIILILFTLLYIIPWLKKNKLSTWWMLLSMLITAIAIYFLLALTCKWEPEFLRHEGMELYAPWWLAGHKQFFVGLTPETAPTFYKIDILDNGVFQSTLLDYPGLFVWAPCCFVGLFVRKK